MPGVAFLPEAPVRWPTPPHLDPLPEGRGRNAILSQFQAIAPPHSAPRLTSGGSSSTFAPIANLTVEPDVPVAHSRRNPRPCPLARGAPLRRLAPRADLAGALLPHGGA